MAKKKVFSIGNALSNGLEETITAAHTYSGDLRIEAIPLRKIELDPENPRDFVITLDDIYQGISKMDPQALRKSDEIASLESISKSIKEQGIINPVVVYKHGEKYRLVAGERRTLGSILAGKLDIQAKILDGKPNELKVSLLQWIENIERSDLSLWERLKNLEKIVIAYTNTHKTTPSKITVTELSQLIGCSKAQAANYKLVLNSHDEIKQLILENKIRNLEKAALIADIHLDAVRQHAIAACIEGATLKKLKILSQQAIRIESEKKRVTEKRGRQTTSVNFGITKNMDVARVVLDSVLKHDALTHISSSFEDVTWSDPKSINNAFKKLIKKLEELHA